MSEPSDQRRVPPPLPSSAPQLSSALGLAASLVGVLVCAASGFHAIQIFVLPIDWDRVLPPWLLPVDGAYTCARLALSIAIALCAVSGNTRPMITLAITSLCLTGLFVGALICSMVGSVSDAVMGQVFIYSVLPLIFVTPLDVALLLRLRRARPSVEPT